MPGGLTLHHVHIPPQIFQNTFGIFSWHKQTTSQSSHAVSSVSVIDLWQCIRGQLFQACSGRPASWCFLESSRVILGQKSPEVVDDTGKTHRCQIHLWLFFGTKMCVCVWGGGALPPKFLFGGLRFPPTPPSMIVVVYHNFLKVTVTTFWSNDSLLFLTSCKRPYNKWSDLYVRYIFHCTYSIRKTFSDNMELQVYSLELACIVSSSVQ